jgi:hypothetical protein
MRLPVVCIEIGEPILTMNLAPTAVRTSVFPEDVPNIVEVR